MMRVMDNLVKGRKKGLEEGESLLSTMQLQLFNNRRAEDVKWSFMDAVCRQTLLNEFSSLRTK